jgi:hypothetical protein
MVKAKVGDLVILGITAENIDGLRNGSPIFFDGETLGLPGRVAIMFGETEIELATEIRQLIIDHAQGGS